MIKKYFTILLFKILLIISTPLLAQQVIDGDTLQIDDKRIRIFGIDTPEKNQTCTTNNKKWACGVVATNNLIKLISNKKVNCTKKGTDFYKRILAVCFVDGIDIGKSMVASGWALAYRQYSNVYIKDEELAKSKKLGLWSSHFVVPWQWRKNKKNK
tara:strand:+ start:149 stop:616 length:468 start_codon:yes stop_codon:yes gene_type:complete